MVSLRTARRLTGAYFILALIAVTWPGILPAARMRPFVFGLPFAFFWVAAWIGFAVVVLFLVDRVEERHRNGGEG